MIIPFASKDTVTALDFALRYAALGWHVFPVWNVLDTGRCACGNDECENVGKHPLSALVPWGQKNASTDETTIRRWWAVKQQANVAIHLAPSGLCAIDIDPRNGGLLTMEMIEARHGPIVSDVLAFTGGGGEHRVFHLPTGYALPGKLGKGVDVKANGYIVAAPSNHASGHCYQWEASSDPLAGAVPSPLPDWIRDLAHATASIGDVPAALEISDADLADLRAALEFICSDDRQVWVDVGMAIHNDVGGQTGFDLWDTWSQSSSKYNPSDSTRVWRSFSRKGISGITKATVFGLAQQGGWKNGRVSIPIIEVLEFPEEEPEKDESFPRYLLSVPGLVGDVQRYIHESAIQPQPVLEIAASLAFCGALFGRKFRSETDLRTNIYAVGVADSGSGKEHARKAIKRLMIECNILPMLGAEKLASDQGLFGAIYNSPSCLLLLDEVGRFMKTINSPKAPTHLATIATSLMELTGSADSIYTEKRRAEHIDSKSPPKIIYQPNVCMYGTTVPGRLFESITPDEIADGFLPRILIFQSDEPDPDSREVSTRAPAAELVRDVSWYAGLSVTPNPTGNLDDVPNPRTMKASKEAQRTFADLKAIERKNKRETRGSGIDAMWSRLTEHGIRLALIRAAGCNPEDPQITADDAQWGADLAQYLITTTIVEIGRNVQRNEQEGSVNKVARFIREQGKVSFSSIGARFKNLKSHEREDIIATLIEAGDVTAFKQTGEGRTGRMIVWGGMGDKGSVTN